MHFQLIFMAFFLCFASCKTPVEVSSNSVPAAPELQVETTTKNVYANDFDNFYSKLKGMNLVFFGENHLNPLYGRIFQSFLTYVEQQIPEHVGVIGLEIPSLYQKRIDSFLESGDERILFNHKSDPDAEILRGHLGQESKQAMLDLFRSVRALNAKRSPNRKMRIVALDQRPATNESYRSWLKHNFASPAYFEWAMQREKHMWNILQSALKSAQSQNQMVFVWTEAEHAQKSGAWQITHATGKKILDIKWLATSATENGQKVTSVLFSKLSDECPDKIQHLLKEQASVHPRLLDLQNTEFGNITDFQCSQPFFKGLDVEFMPKNNAAKSLFDFYWFLPQN